MTAATVHPLIDRHQQTLDRAVTALGERDYWSPYPEFPKAYGEDAMAVGAAAFEALKGTTRLAADELVGPAVDAGGEVSPFGGDLDIAYGYRSADALMAAAVAAQPAWAKASPLLRAAVCLEILARINARSVEFGFAVQHTTGQAFGMAFQAGGPHAQDRGLEAVAAAFVEQTKIPAKANWTKPQGKRDPLQMEKEFLVRPRGVGLVIGCNTFPTWNGFPGFFASLATGNTVVVKPHPRAILPLALTVEIARDVLTEAGFDADVVQLAPEQPGEGLAKTLATRPEVAIIDYTGSTAFGDWLEENARQALVYTEKAGVNTVLVESTDNYAAALGNLAFSLSLYSGQMCTTPQNLLIPRAGIATDQGSKSFAEVVADLSTAVGRLLSDDAKASQLLGAVVNPGVLQRIERAEKGELGELALAPRAVVSPEFPEAVIRTPALVTLDAAKDELPGECFGPVAFAIAVDSAAHGVELLAETVRTRGAMSAAAYTTSPEVEGAVVDAAVDAGVSLSLNLTGQVFVNQTAAFSDLHGTGANPAANAAYTDAAFVASRFRVMEVRRHNG
ncbi:phenylacetic acid degradation protein PaaN [Streptacidiphilus jiangxiensis]|uniref:Phenylacetic acid degradation protein paaN n=1 Tax=Streptacidiphilus jiangxiensis TaxID=235985 RepID=A0A1H7JG79_STRJI|nr:phenylacetic acid degradation protein PaaN [Streptacidiphilus jiangxiensis]SEK73631.1 phenylacetic acid degradation protein paaN [Streptacidiphilus jiangxiensis]